MRALVFPSYSLAALGIVTLAGCVPELKPPSDLDILNDMPPFAGTAGTSCSSSTPAMAYVEGLTMTGASVDVTQATATSLDNMNVSLAHSGTTGSTDYQLRDVANAGADTWYHQVEDGDADDGTMFNCGPDSSGNTAPEACSGVYSTAVAPTPSGLTDCEHLGVPVMDVWGTYTTAFLYRPAAECTGDTNARFALFPLVAHDRDGDGEGYAIFRGIQLTGSGVMTARSSVTSITVVDNPGYTLRVMKAGQTYSFDGGDQLVNASNNSIALSGTTSISTGVVRGHPDFVVSEPEGADLGGFTVDMTWSCESSGGTSTSPPLGYQIDLEDLDLDTKQKLVMRPLFGATPKRIEWEIYGDPRARFATPVQVTGEGHAFTLEWGLLSLEGVVLSNGQQSASVRLDLLEWDGDEVGTTGTYSLPVE